MAELERIGSEGVARDAGAALPARSRTGRGRVDRSIARAMERPCARPGCAAPATATLRFSYAEREASVELLADQRLPQAYDLCVAHAARTRPPQGWTLRDRRPEDERRPDVPPPTPADLGGDHTVAVLAAALRATPVSEDAVATTAEVGPSVPVEPAAGAVQERLIAPPSLPARPATRPPLVVRQQTEATGRPGAAADW